MPAKLFRILFAILFVLALGMGAPGVFAQGPSPAVMAGPELVILADPAYSSLHIPAPAAALAPRRNGISSIAVTFLPAGAIDTNGSPCLDFPADAQAAYLYAVNIWNAYINTPVLIRISACWRQLPVANLGSAGPTSVYMISTSGSLSNVWYPAALANALTLKDQTNGNYAIASRFTSNIGAGYGPWYFGTDGNIPSGSYDFASVVLHEIGHGLGFFGSMQVSNGIGYYGLSGFPVIYDKFTQVHNGAPLLSLLNSSAQLGTALTSAVDFSGPRANAANGGQPVPLFAPSPWKPGSSYSHLDDSFNDTPNALMTYSLQASEVVHDPGPVTLGVLADLGWVMAAPDAPSGLVASTTSASQINLSWQDKSSNETGFQIERSTNNSTWVTVATALPNATSYPNTGLASGTKYFYRVKAVAGSFSSAYAAALPAITLGPPPPPTALAARASSDTRIDLSWRDGSNITSGYVLERSDDLGLTWTPLATVAANPTSYSDLGLGIGKTYQYRVKTASAQGNSAPSGPVSATTWAKVNNNFVPMIHR